MEDYIQILISLGVLVFYSFFLVFLINVKNMFEDGVSLGFVCFVIAGSLLVLIRVLNVLSEIQVFSLGIPYFHEVLALLISFFLFLGVFNLRKNILSLEKGDLKER